MTMIENGFVDAVGLESKINEIAEFIAQEAPKIYGVLAALVSNEGSFILSGNAWTVDLSEAAADLAIIVQTKFFPSGTRYILGGYEAWGRHPVCPGGWRTVWEMPSPNNVGTASMLEEPESPLSGPREIDGDTYFSPYDLARYELAQIKVENSYMAIALKRAATEKAKYEYEAALLKAKEVYEANLRQNNEEVAQLLGISKNLENLLRTLQAELAASYKINLSKISYDDQTGKITVLEENR
jgi:hypothetical protein